MNNLQKYSLTETQDFIITDKESGFNLKCYALSYIDKSLFCNGYYRFGIYSQDYQSFFTTKYDCDPDQADTAIVQDIFSLLADKIEDDFGIDIETNLFEKYYWLHEPSKSTMVISYVLDEYYEDEEEE
jgi:hypothetical protein